MGDKQNIIEINGKRLDAVTGKVVGASSSDISTKTVDGFVRRKFVPKTARISASSPVKAATVHKKTQHSKTLMRTVVKKPVAASKQSPVTSHTTPPLAPVPQGTQTIDKSRFARAKSITKSSLISRFGPKTATTDIKPVASTQKTTPKATTAAHPSSASTSKTALQKTLHTALANADSHLQKPHKPARKRSSLSERLNISQKALNISMFAIAFLAIGSFIAYQNVPNLSMRLAVAKSGVGGSLPDYKPSGFSMNGPIYYQPGQITLSYKSNSDDRAFNIIQKKSSWNNEALLEKYVAASNRTYQTFQEKDKTIYIYDSNNASWINDGVWYEIKGTSALSQEQLVKLANSL